LIDRLQDSITRDWTDTYSQNTPEIVIQQVQTRLLLWIGEWFMNISEGTPWIQDILGNDTNYDLEIQARILGTQGVVEIVSYSSEIINRNLSVQASINTVYGPGTLTITLGQ